MEIIEYLEGIYIQLKKGIFGYGRDIGDGIHIDYSEDGEILGIEILKE